MVISDGIPVVPRNRKPLGIPFRVEQNAEARLQEDGLGEFFIKNCIEKILTMSV
jgi:hypothetical protein